MDRETIRKSKAFNDALERSAALERRRIRRIVAPHLKHLVNHFGPGPYGIGPRRCLAAIDAATKAPRKARKGK